jgi:hypothetical protein
MLSERQKNTAARLLANRPAVLPNTRVIISDIQRKFWYDLVCAEMNRVEVVHPNDVAEFCDLAGVAD